MSTRSLAVAPSARNYLVLTKLFQLSHQQYARQGLLDEQAFMAFLQEFVELIETICEKNLAICPDYQIARIEFYRYIKNNAWQQASTLEPFFDALAYLVRYGVEGFKRCGYPECYTLFVRRLELIFDNESVIQAGYQKAARSLIEQLRQKPPPRCGLRS